MILVTGATGNVGGALVARLSATGVPARALVRSPARGDDLRGYDVDVAIGSYEDPASLEAALAGVDRVFLLSPPSPQMADHELALVTAVQAHAPQAHVVTLAAAGIDADPLPPVRFLREHRRVVDGLAAAGIAHTVLAPGSFMQNLLRQAGYVQEQGALYSSMGDAALSHVDVRDVAAVAAHVLTSEGHAGATYTITGPEALTYPQVAETLSRVLGRPVTSRDVPADQARAGMVAGGLSEWVADGLAELDEVYRSGAGAGVTDEVQKATGKPARTLEAFLTEHRAAFT